MRLNNWKLYSVFLCSLFGNQFAEASILYTLGFNNGDIFAVDTTNTTGSGGYTFFNPFPANTSPSGITFIDDRFAYVSDAYTLTLYQVDFTLQSASSLSLNPKMFNPAGITFLDFTQNTLLVGTESVNNNYIVDIQAQTTSPYTNPQQALSSIEVAIPATLGYGVAGVFQADSHIYSLDLTLSNPPATASSYTIGSDSLAFLQLTDSTSAYVITDTGKLYHVTNLATGDSQLIVDLAVYFLGADFVNGFAIDPSTGLGYLVNYNNNQVIEVNLTTKAVRQVTTIPSGSSSNPGLSWVAFAPSPPPIPPIPPAPPAPRFIRTAGLKGNNLIFAKYLNSQAPQQTREVFANLTNGLEKALEAAAPTRNAFVTFSSQNGFLSSSQVTNAHLRNRRFINGSDQVTELAAFVADCSDEFAVNFDDCSDVEPGFCIWATPFGEYAREKRQHQSPAFHLGVGGVVAALDYNTCGGHVFGFGGAYVHTNVHEDHHAGHAKINQGYLTAYTTMNTPVYFDVSVWGGYYAGNNQRHIEFDSIDVTARAKIHGWQFASHAEVGYTPFYRCDRWFGWEPFMAADWVGNWQKGFHESGAGMLNMGQRGHFSSFVRAEGGFRLTEIVEFSCGGKLIFQEVGSYVYQKAFHTGSITAFLIGSPGSFTVTTLTSGQNLGLISFSAQYVWEKQNPPYIEVRYQGEFGSSFQSHLASIEFGKKF